MNSKLVKIISRSFSKNIAVSGFFSNYPVEDYYIEGESALIIGKSDRLWAHIVSSSEVEFIKLINKYYSVTKYYFSLEDWMIPLILAKSEKDWIMNTDRYILDDELIVDAPSNEIIGLNESHAPYIYKNSDYKTVNSVEYFEDRLSKDISCGILKDDKLVAWGFTHDDGAIGSLHVLPEYRRKGYANDILSGLIGKIRGNKRPVFGNVVPENTASINLLRKTGFKFDCRVSWLKIK
jgi:ribosomal protein S18 acetylase RimI-like enzyme